MKAWHCQAALAVTQFAFCLGSVYLKRSLRNINLDQSARFHPIIYAFLREAVAGPIMCLIAFLQTSKFPSLALSPCVLLLCLLGAGCSAARWCDPWLDPGQSLSRSGLPIFGCCTDVVKSYHSCFQHFHWLIIKRAWFQSK